MRRLALAALLLVGCKERGTIHIDLSQPCPNGNVTAVRFQAVKNGTCDACTCSTCSCVSSADQQCLIDVPCDGAGCPIEEARANGIDFDPPSAGRYALTYELVDASQGPAALPVAVFCTVVEVDADGTASTRSMPAPACCM
jgi:hypothetical protein